MNSEPFSFRDHVSNLISMTKSSLRISHDVKSRLEKVMK